MNSILSRSDDGKTCRKCLVFKKYEQFPAESRNKDGRAARCRECEYARSKEWADTIGVEKRKISMSKYQSSEKGKAAKKRAEVKFNNRSMALSPLKYKAHLIVSRALRSGELLKRSSCESCGNNCKRIHGHHDDYAYPMSVRWLCSKCHSDWHKANGSGING